MMERERSATRNRFDLFMNTLYVREGMECKIIFGGNKGAGYKGRKIPKDASGYERDLLLLGYPLNSCRT